MKKRFLLFTACAVLALGASAMAFSACGEDEGKGKTDVPEHEHVWSDTFTTTKRATCSEEGERVYYCTVPGCTAEKPEPVEKAPHTWGDQPSSTATCESGGTIIWTCKVCGATEEGNPVPALGHDDVAQNIVRDATCLQAGEVVMKCTRCEREVTVELPQLEHDFRYDEKKSEKATCKAPGKEVYTCVNGCNETKEEIIEKLDHEVEYEENILPTFESEGHRKGVCVNCKTPINEVIPKLVDGDEIVFTYLIMKGDRVFNLSTTTFKVINEKGEVVATGTMKDVAGGRFKVKLPIHKDTKYTLKMENISGYTADEITLTPAEPSGEVQVSAKLFEIGDPAAPKFYSVGSIMQDFNFKDIDGNEIHFKDILKQNKVVMLDLFYGNCPACNIEAPHLQELYEQYKSRGFTIIGISSDAYENSSDTKLKSFRSDHGITYPIVRQPASATEAYLFDRFDISGFPTTVVIDHEGFVRSMATGAYGKEYHEMKITSYLNMKWDDMEESNDQTISVKPEQDADGLTLSVLRGDYILGDERDF